MDHKINFILVNILLIFLKTSFNLQAIFTFSPKNKVHMWGFEPATFVSKCKDLNH